MEASNEIKVWDVFVRLFHWVLAAAFFLVVWFAIQFFQGAMTITALEQGGVAWWAHIGGFVAGVIAAGSGRLTGLLKPVHERLPRTDHMTAYRYHRNRGLFG